jgi:hypothetical protein
MVQEAPSPRTKGERLKPPTPKRSPFTSFDIRISDFDFPSSFEVRASLLECSQLTQLAYLSMSLLLTCFGPPGIVLAA